MLNAGYKHIYNKSYEKILVKKMLNYKFYDILVALLVLLGLLLSNIEVSFDAILTPSQVHLYV